MAKINSSRAALDALGQQDDGLLDVETLGGLTRCQAEAVAKQVRRLAKSSKPKDAR